MPTLHSPNSSPSAPPSPLLGALEHHLQVQPHPRLWDNHVLSQCSGDSTSSQPYSETCWHHVSYVQKLDACFVLHIFTQQILNEVHSFVLKRGHPEEYSNEQNRCIALRNQPST